MVYSPDQRGSLGHRYQELERIRKDLWEAFRQDYVSWLRRQGGKSEGPLPEVDDLVLVKDVPPWKGDGWPVARVTKVIHRTDEPRLYELEIVPTEELRKEPKLINNRRRLLLEKKCIVRNYRQLGLLPKIGEPSLGPA